MGAAITGQVVMTGTNYMTWPFMTACSSVDHVIPAPCAFNSQWSSHSLKFPLSDGIVNYLAMTSLASSHGSPFSSKS